ncbi:hypothetical protein [Sphaerisporangium perillae]|uniref:hypothetical protein n=1 Tax=Sphaerisporangium perillae TaxID=2935860 RepID=UPI00200CB43E|nr:hypothetical protein [Sphaerisporangium perillae]
MKQLAHIAYPMLTAAGLLLLVAAPFEVLTEIDDRPYSQQALASTYHVDSLLGLVSTLCLFLGVAAVAGRTGPGGRMISGPACVTVLLGLMGAAFLQAVSVFLVPSLATSAPAVLDAPPSGWHAAGVIVSLALWVVGIVWLSVSAFRSRVFPRIAAVVLGVGGAATFFGPISGFLMGIGLLWIGIAGIRLKQGGA